jgi:DNA polymerase III epsilon subunit-like protein
MIKMPPTHPPALVFDTETCGLRQPIICQIAFLKFVNGEIVETYDELLKLPLGFRIDKRAKEKHCISEEDCAMRGVDPVDALETFALACSDVLLKGGRVVAHNSAFDVRAVNETRLAHNIIGFGENQDLDARHTFCTMRSSKIYSPLKDKANRTKAFSNEELFEFLYGQRPNFAKLHDALEDIRVTALNYIAGLERGWW